MSNSTDPQGDNTDRLEQQVDEIFLSNFMMDDIGRSEFADAKKAVMSLIQRDRERVQIEARIDEQGNTVADAEGSIYYSAGDAITDDVRQHSRLEHLKAQLSQSIEKEEV